MFRITDQAIAYLASLRLRRGLDERVGVRFVRSAKGPGLEFATHPRASDRVVADVGIPIFLAAELTERFERSVVDTRSDGGRTRLVVRAARS